MEFPFLHFALGCSHSFLKMNKSFPSSLLWKCKMFGCVPHWAGTRHVLHGSLFTDGITPLQHCSTAVGGGATIRGGKLQWWAGPGCSVRHGALFRDEIMGWPGSGWRPRSPQPPCLQGSHPWPSVSVMYCYQGKCSYNIQQIQDTL